MRNGHARAHRCKYQGRAPPCSARYVETTNKLSNQQRRDSLLHTRSTMHFAARDVPPKQDGGSKPGADDVLATRTAKQTVLSARLPSCYTAASRGSFSAAAAGQHHGQRRQRLCTKGKQDTKSNPRRTPHLVHTKIVALHTRQCWAVYLECCKERDGVGGEVRKH